METEPSSFEQRRKWSVQSAESELPPSSVVRFHGYFSWWSLDHMRRARLTCLRLFTHAMRFALSLLEASAGRSNPARIAMIAITTSNSMSVNADEYSGLDWQSLRFTIILSCQHNSCREKCIYCCISRLSPFSNHTSPALARNSHASV